MRKVIATRHQKTQNAYTCSRTTPDVSLGTAARSSVGQLNTQKGTMQQSMMECKSFMKTTMQTLVQNQNVMLLLLADKQSK